MQPPASFSEYSALGTAMMSPYFKQIRNVYIDLECCFDYKLGAIIQQLISTDVEYQYILYRLPMYEKAIDLETAKYFPQLRLKESQILEVLNNPKFNRNLCLGSPITESWRTIDSMIQGINTFNKHKDTNDPVTYYFNCTSLHLHEDAKLMIKHQLKTRIDPFMRVEFLDREINSYPESFIETLDYFVVYDILNFFRKGSTCARLGEANEFLTKFVFSRIQVTHTDDIEQRIENQQIHMAAVCDFTFIRNKIITGTDQ